MGLEALLGNQSRETPARKNAKKATAAFLKVATPILEVDSSTHESQLHQRFLNDEPVEEPVRPMDKMTSQVTLNEHLDTPPKQTVTELYKPVHKPRDRDVSLSPVKEESAISKVSAQPQVVIPLQTAPAARFKPLSALEEQELGLFKEEFEKAVGHQRRVSVTQALESMHFIAPDKLSLSSF